MAAINTICFTGNRQQKLGGFDRNPTTDYVKAALRGAIERAVKQRVETFISGGNLGIGQWAADIILDLKATESKKTRGRINNIKLIVAQVCPSQSERWPQETKRKYDKILQKSDRIIAISDDPYSPAKMQIRNEWMIDNSDAVITIWDGSSGWAADTVGRAKKIGKPVLVIDPKEESERWILAKKGSGKQEPE